MGNLGMGTLGLPFMGCAGAVNQGNDLFHDPISSVWNVILFFFKLILFKVKVSVVHDWKYRKTRCPSQDNLSVFRAVM